MVDPVYSGGDYFQDCQRHSEDAEFKAHNFLKLFLRTMDAARSRIRSYVDVGCGSGDIVKIVSCGLKDAGFSLTRVEGYDVSPHVGSLSHKEIRFVQGNFCQSNEEVDLVTLFDVFEHIPDPISFIKQVAERSKIIGLHIPLDNSLNVAMRDMFRSKLKNPGHLIFLDSVSALNLLAFSGLTVIAYEYTFNFLAPSGRNGTIAKLALPIRALLARVSPWLLSKTIGGASLLVIALTPSNDYFKNTR
jgi:SAM-dependent methyltransferase